ncbi:hypothetical protein BJ875DRAFT_483423 [Amylocarpus encephaloides]|uniref:Uncharacterized protein n=1 Tax=Amylocarpus encephaloides TaxID=45428 RepID=A0A9P7YKH3_9HELO|nr:hypothetical protein BJ875DRAFT_483423 [Amylocarpus encephaloides]
MSQYPTRFSTNHHDVLPNSSTSPPGEGLKDSLAVDIANALTEDYGLKSITGPSKQNIRSGIVDDEIQYFCEDFDIPESRPNTPLGDACNIYRSTPQAIETVEYLRLKAISRTTIEQWPLWITASDHYKAIAQEEGAMIAAEEQYRKRKESRQGDGITTSFKYPKRVLKLIVEMSDITVVNASQWSLVQHMNFNKLNDCVWEKEAPLPSYLENVRCPQNDFPRLVLSFCESVFTISPEEEASWAPEETLAMGQLRERLYDAGFIRQRMGL